MPFTPVIPSSYQQDRQDLHDCLEGLIQAFIVSESYECGRVWLSSLPDSFTGEGPMIVLGDITEATLHDSGTRRTVFAGQLFYVDWITDRDEVGTRVDRWADKMRDLFTANPIILLNDGLAAELVQLGFAEGEFTQGSTVYAAPSIAFEFRVQRGRD